jgi:hypothetical protein
MNIPNHDGSYIKNSVIYKHGSILNASEKYILNSCAARGDGNDVMYS